MMKSFVLVAVLVSAAIVAPETPPIVYIGFQCDGYGSEDVVVTNRLADLEGCARYEVHQFEGN